jgi:hypothetical protein
MENDPENMVALERITGEISDLNAWEYEFQIKDHFRAIGYPSPEPIYQYPYRVDRKSVWHWPAC